MQESNVVFGYGSLILDTSLAGRFRDVSSVDPIYEDELSYSDSGLLREDALDEWEELSERVMPVPVKIYGMKRRYTLDSDRGGAMLETVHTGDNEDFINGILYYGLDPDEVEQVSDDEENYNRKEIDASDLEPYPGEQELAEKGIEIPGNISLFDPKDKSEIQDLQTERSKNITYHGRILRGIDRLAEEYGEELAMEFRDDFLWSTEERTEIGIEEYEPVWIVNMLRKMEK